MQVKLIPGFKKFIKKLEDNKIKYTIASGSNRLHIRESMKKVKLNILGLSYSQTQTGAYALVLSEAEGTRRIPIIIGAVEAQAIAIQLEGLKPPRPLTH